MALTDEQLLDFDASRLANYSRARAEETLRGEHAEVFRSHLFIAQWMDMWREGVERPGLGENRPEWLEGFGYAMREVAANLRQGDLIPGGTLNESYVRAHGDGKR